MTPPASKGIYLSMHQTSQNQYGLGFFNLFRGAGLLWVIAGHSLALFSTQSSILSDLPVFSHAGRVLGGGIMVMFFMISGFYFFRRSPKKCLTMQARLLLKPYAVTALATVIGRWVYFTAGHRATWRNTASMVLTYALGLNATHGETLLGLPVYTISIFWFVLALFGGWVLFNLIQQIPHKGLRTLCVVLCVIVGWLLTEISKVWILALPMALLAVGYIAAGCEIKQQDWLSRPLPWYVWVAISAFSLLSLAFGDVDIAACVWKMGLLDIVGSFCVGFLMLRLYFRIMQHNFTGRLVRLLERIGVNSVWIICIHAFEKTLLPWKDLAKLLPDLPLLCGILCLLGRCLLIYLIFKLLRHFGRRKRHRVTLEL